ncbi:MAG: glycerol-3-phosphate acyltransferase [Anaerolineales bacterium]|nr:glycerol-3-phosphate acyltransferase [Anaerolineales bacterium]MCW5855066.1 glycerol-3-phosphate acyltransferase [Anaerolineales bacterium]
MEAKLVLSLVSSYLIGSIPFTQILARWVKGIDLRQVGSRNVGGRNLSRQLGVAWGLLGGALDVAKGAAALWLAEVLGVDYPERLLNGMAVVAGHNWPVWLRFHGGKGLLAALGAISYIVFPEGFWSFVVGMAILLPTRNILYTSTAGFASMLVVAARQNRPAEIVYFIIATWGVVFLASLPDVIKTLRTPGALKAYLHEPDAVYRQSTQKRKKP